MDSCTSLKNYVLFNLHLCMCSHTYSCIYIYTAMLLVKKFKYSFYNRAIVRDNSNFYSLPGILEIFLTINYYTNKLNFKIKGSEYQ